MQPTRRLLLMVLYATLGGSAASAQSNDPVAEAKRLRDEHRYAAAADALLPYLKQHPDDAGTHWFRAQLLSWAGARTAARREYERALALTPANTPAADSLTRYAADLSDTWASAGLTISSDDQPLRGTTVGLEVGRYLGAHLAVTGDAARAHQTAEDEPTLNTTTISSAQLGMRYSANTVSLGMAAGGEHASGANRSAAIGNAWLALGTKRGITLTAAAARTGYHYTVASIDTLVIMSTIEAGLERVAETGVIGRIALRRESFDEGSTQGVGRDNSIGIVYGWIMLPVTHGLRLGYASDARDAKESRWDGVRYDPYYTPESVHVHSAIGAWSWHDFRHSVQLNGGVGFHARELAPFALNPSGHQVGLASRSFTPWNADAKGTWRVSYHMSLEAEAQHIRTAFYNATSVHFGTTLLIQ